MELVTLEKMKQKDSPYEAIQWALEQRGKYPNMPERPRLPKTHTADDAKKYADDYKSYESDVAVYKKHKDDYNKLDNQITSIVVEYIKDESGLNTYVPAQYLDKVYSYADNKSHSDGYFGLFKTLIDLVEIFK